MALPKWITPAGNLGIVPELEYYEFPLDAYDASAGTLEYDLVSGQLPLGIQVIRTGKLQGIPVSEQGGDQNVKYTFTIRAANTTTGYVTDRTFDLTITNVAPPIINYPLRNSYIGLYLDGTEVSLQLEAIEFTPGADLEWTLKSGELPPGLTLSTSGLLSGYVQPIPSPAPGTDPGWDRTAWNYIGWDFTLRAINKIFTFTVQVADGVKYDLSTYTIEVFPRGSITADSDTLQVDATTDISGIELTVDLGLLHNPIITTTQSNIPLAREGSYFSFNIDAFDLDGDVVNYAVDALASGAFDEQTIVGPSPSYIASKLTNNNTTLSTGVYPYASDFVIIGSEYGSLNDITRVNLVQGEVVKVLKTDLIDGFQYDLWYLATVTNQTTVRLTGSTRITGNVGDFITQDSSAANATIVNVSATTGTIRANGSILTGFINTLGALPRVNLFFTGNVSANVGDYVTQTITGSNAIVTANTVRFMTFSDVITANIGSYITQFGNTGNAQILDTVVGSATAFVRFISGAFSLGVGSGNIKVDGANVGVFPLTSVSTSNVVPVLYNTGTFSNSSAGWISINGANAGVRLSTTTDIPNTIVLQANIGDTITQIGSAATATVTANIVDDINIPVEFTGSTFTINSGNLQINGGNVAVYPISIVTTPVLQAITANVGDYITQPSTGANAQVTRTVYNALTVPVIFLANNFSIGSSAGNLRVNGANVKSFPANVVCNTDITCDYNTVNTFNLNVSDASAIVKINSNSTNSYISSVTSVGVTLGLLATEGTIGFDESKFDQGTLELPAGLSINTTTGWITGQLPLQTVNEKVYEFEVTAFKRDDASYNDKQLYTLTVLGDLNNRIDWITPSDLGTIQNGKVSDLFVRAISTKGKTLVYKLTGGEYLNMPQGLSLTSNGLLSGRVSFQLFSLDQGTTFFDPTAIGEETTTFDQTYSFTITASDIDGTISADQTFSIRVINANIKPYEDLYLKALPTQSQRQQFNDIIQDRTVFPLELVYRNEDPFFGLAKNIKTLFLPGLNPTELADYTAAASTNHFNKRITFGNIKTARALDTNFNTKYEVVYLEIQDQNTNSLGQGPADIQNPLIDNPYYDLDGNTYTVAYPNAFSNMKDVMVDNSGYANKGALPDWMTSKQANGRVLGFTRAVVLGYVVPGAADKIAYRLGQRDINFNEIDFTVDRYQVDNNLTTNYDIAANAFITSTETTFDRYPATTTAFTDVGGIDYAIRLPFDEVNNHTVGEIQSLGGMDGVVNFQDGDTLVFATQEFRQQQVDISDYNQGWSNIQSLWDSVGWDYDVDTTDNPYTEEYGYIVSTWGANTNITAGQTILNSGTYYRAEFDFTSGAVFSTTAVVGASTVTVLTALPTPVFPYDSPGVGWDEAGYIPGYTEYNLGTRYPPTTLGFPDDPIDQQLAFFNGKTYTFNVDSNQWELANQRIGVWRINIDSEDIVTLTFIQSIKLYDKLFVRNGQTYGATNIYYDPVVKEGNIFANYSIIPQQVLTLSTRFDGNGTRFFDYRDQYTLPEAGDKYIKFTKYGVFT